MPFDRDILGHPIAPVSVKPLRVTQAVLPHEAQNGNTGLHSINKKQPGKDRGETLRQKRHRLRRTAGALLKGERVRKCGYNRTGQTVDIHRSTTGAHFVGLETCGSVWHCPVCAAKIAETRRDEVAQVIDGVKEQGGSSFMLTLTMRHNRGDKLSHLREHIVNGWRKVQNRKVYRELKAEYGVLGTVRAIEVTHGKNGWHPHLHILFMFDRSLSTEDAAYVEATLFRLWELVIDKQGGGAISLAALDFRPATASDYVTKWGADRELVKGQEKLGNGSRSPWQLLGDVKDDPQAGALFKEYADTFKGSRQLTWSKGLKAMFGIGEVDDLDAAATREESDELLPLSDGLHEGHIGAVDSGTWNAVLRLKISADVLDAAHKSGWHGVIDLLSSHGLRPYHAESYAGRQHPKGHLPAHPKRYMTLAADEMIYGPLKPLKETKESK